MHTDSHKPGSLSYFCVTADEGDWFRVVSFDGLWCQDDLQACCRGLPLSLFSSLSVLSLSFPLFLSLSQSCSPFFPTALHPLLLFFILSLSLSLSLLLSLPLPLPPPLEGPVSLF